LSAGVRVVIASVFVPRKGILQTLEAIASIRDMGYLLVVDIYGDGPLLPSIRNKIRSLDLSDIVNLHGFVSRSEVLKSMRAAHLFVMPSAPETFGQAYLEAMASGCVVIGHRGWGIDGIVLDKVSGYLVDSADRVSI